MQAPVLVLNQSTKRETGRKAQQGNIAAAKAVSEIIRTTLGPRSMLKMLLDPMGGIVITNDGNAILREIDVSHPAAKSMIELSRSQDEEVGDGTTSVIILAGELLYQAEPFLLRQMHPTVIVRAFHRAMEAALAICDEMAVDVDTDNPAEMRAIIRSCLGTKMVSRYGDLMCDLAMQAVSTVSVTRADGTKDINLKHFARVEKLPGGELEDCRVLNGVMFNKDVTHGRMRRRIENPRVLLMDTPVEYKKGESQTNLEITKEEDWEKMLHQEEVEIEKMCTDILRFKPDVLICEKGISDLAVHFLSKGNVSCIRRIRKSDNNRIARVSGATIVSRTTEITEEDIGTDCGLFEVRKMGDEYFTFMEECKDPKACTILLRGGSKDVLNEVERNLADAMGVARNIYFEPKLLPGGGATEMSIATGLAAASKSVAGVEAWPFKAVASAMEVIPRTLAQNCGADVIRVLTQMRAQKAGGKNPTLGLDGVKGTLADMNDLGVWDPYSVKVQTIKTAVEASCMLLRIDEIVSGISKHKIEDKTPAQG